VRRVTLFAEGDEQAQEILEVHRLRPAAVERDLLAPKLVCSGVNL